LDVLKEFEECCVVVCGVKKAYVLNCFKDKGDFIRDFYRNYEFVDDLYVDDDVLKISVADWSNCIEKDVSMIRERLPECLQLVTSGNVWFDIFNKSVNKGTAIKFVWEYFNIKREECMAFGDQMNDYDLLNNVGESYAMDNACDTIKMVF